jgi:hypothetical protein
MRAKESGARASKRRKSPRAAGWRSPGEVWLVVSMTSVASCTVWPAATGDGGEPRDAAAEERRHGYSLDQ